MYQKISAKSSERTMLLCSFQQGRSWCFVLICWNLSLSLPCLFPLFSFCVIILISYFLTPSIFCHAPLAFISPLSCVVFFFKLKVLCIKSRCYGGDLNGRVDINSTLLSDQSKFHQPWLNLQRWPFSKRLFIPGPGPVPQLCLTFPATGLTCLCYQFVKKLYPFGQHLVTCQATHHVFVQ